MEINFNIDVCMHAMILNLISLWSCIVCRKHFLSSIGQEHKSSTIGINVHDNMSIKNT